MSKSLCTLGNSDLGMILAYLPNTALLEEISTFGHIFEVFCHFARGGPCRTLRVRPGAVSDARGALGRFRNRALTGGIVVFALFCNIQK